MKLALIAAAVAFTVSAAVGTGVGMKRASAAAVIADSLARADSAHAANAEAAAETHDVPADSNAATAAPGTGAEIAATQTPAGIVASEIAGGTSHGAATATTTAATPATDGASPSRPTTPVPDSVGRLPKLFTAMSARDAAKVFEQMGDGDVVIILRGMTDRRAGEILAALPPARSAVIARAMLTQTASQP